MADVRTTHTGSLPRPPELVELMYAKQEGQPIDAAALAEAERRAVVDAVKRQREAGIDVVSDGEMTKSGFITYVGERLTGFGGVAPPWQLEDMREFPELLVAQYGGEAGAHIAMPQCEGAVRYRGQAEVAADLQLLRAALDENGVADAFVPAASPGSITMAVPNRHYADYEDFIFAVADAMAEEYRAIVDAGLTLQLDCPDIPMACHTTGAASAAVERLGYRGYVELHVAAINRAVAALPPGRMRMHVCWGNYVGPHHMDVPIGELLDLVFAARPCGLSFEAANPRHEHEWEAFQRAGVPDDKVLLPGVIDTKTNVVEHPRVVAQRLERFVSLVGGERVIGGTDCGFGTFVGFGMVLPRVAWMKLAALGQGARLLRAGVA